MDGKNMKHKLELGSVDLIALILLVDDILQYSTEQELNWSIDHKMLAILKQKLTNSLTGYNTL